MNKTSIIEALIFSTNRGLDISQLTRFTDFSKTEVESILTEIQERYENEEHGIRLKRVDKLTPSQLEVLAIVAKNGKSTKSQVEVVRGKDCSNQLLELLLSGLLKRKRVKAPGRPYAYSVTDNFYEIFKMSDLELYEELGEDMPNEAEENDEAKTMIE
jgi:segregation and condensation protein B